MRLSCQFLGMSNNFENGKDKLEAFSHSDTAEENHLIQKVDSILYTPCAKRSFMFSCFDPVFSPSRAYLDRKQLLSSSQEIARIAPSVCADICTLGSLCKIHAVLFLLSPPAVTGNFLKKSKMAARVVLFFPR